MYWAYLIFSYVLHLRAITIIKSNRDKSHLVRKLKRNLNHNMDYAFSYTAISRKVVGKTVHATIRKGNTGYDQCTSSWHCSCRIYFCCFLLAFANIRPWLLVPFFEISLKTVNSKTPAIPFGIVACTFSDNLSWNSCIQYWVVYAALFLKKGQYIAGEARKALKQARTSGSVCLWLAPRIKCFQHITLDRQWNATK